MSGKQHKREAKRTRQAAREAQRRRERWRTIQTIIIIAITMVIGGVLIWVSLEDPEDELASSEETPDPEPAVDPCQPAPAPQTAGESKPTFPEGPEQVLDDGLNYRAVIDTSCGRMIFQLLEDDAPETVNSFVFLAQEEFFDGLAIFRNAPGISALQTGAGDDTNTWDIDYTLPDETARAEEFGGYEPGAIAMAKGDPDTGGSQFFMVYGASGLPPDYTLFGQLVEGLDVLQSIGAIPTEDPADPANDTPSVPVYVERVTIETEAGEPAGPLAPVETPEPAGRDTEPAIEPSPSG
ncbi:MAG: hypothetical protein GEU81_06050 [Nitriliruptorales bacterium]|nr:hypothetical protein [Nitriliruptorales bacterium]